MKILIVICRILLGLMFTVFGLNGFLHFIPAPPPPGLAGQFLGAVVQSGFAYGIFAFQLIGGVLLLVNQFVPLAVTILAAEIVNILLFHIAMAPAGLPLALIAALLWAVVFYSVRYNFAGIFAQKAGTAALRKTDVVA